MLRRRLDGSLRKVKQLPRPSYGIIPFMRIDAVECSDDIEEKLDTKHRVSLREVRQLFLNRPRIRFAEQGHTVGEDVYVAFGQTYGGRFLSVFFIYKPDVHLAWVLSARDMSPRERKSYGRK